MRLVPVSAALLAAHREALWTALALVMDARARARLFTGRILFVSGEKPLAPLGAGVWTGSLADIALKELSSGKRPYALGWPRDDSGIREAAVTCIVGEAELLCRFLAQTRVSWPHLVAMIYHSRLTGDAERAAERTELAHAVRESARHAPVLLLETCWRPEAAIALEDPRHGLPRLLAAHGTFLEFIPTAEVDHPQPTRHTAAQVEKGVPYEVAVTSPAGLWACRVGLTVCFEQREPLLLRVLPTALPDEITPPARSDVALTPFPLQPPHPRTDGTPAALPETPFHTLSSIPGDRG
jgi:hypothetical protein